MGQLRPFNRQIHFADFTFAAKENQYIASLLIAVNILQTVDNHLIAISLHCIRVVVDNLYRKTSP